MFRYYRWLWVVCITAVVGFATALCYHMLQPEASSTDPTTMIANVPSAPLTADHVHTDLGMVAPGSTTATAYQLTNNTDDPIEIIKLSPSCGCSPATVDGNVIDPHATKLITMHYNAGTPWEKRSYSLDVETTVGVIRLTYSVQVVVFIRADPPSIYFGVINENQTLKRTIELIALRDNRFEIKQVVCKNPHIHFEVKGDGATLKKRIDVQFQSKELMGEWDSTLQVLTTDPNCPVVTVPITWHSAKLRPFSPEALYFTAKKGDSVTGSIFYKTEAEIITADAASGAIDVEHSIAGLTVNDCTFTRIRPDYFRIDLTCELPTKGGFQESKVTLRNNSIHLDASFPISIYCR